MNLNQSKRREFVKTISAVAAGAVLLPVGKVMGMSPAKMPTRKLGRTGEEVSLMGLGGFHIGLK